MRLPPLAALFYSLNSLRARSRLQFNTNIGITHTHGEQAPLAVAVVKRRCPQKAGMEPWRVALGMARQVAWGGARGLAG